MNYDIKTGSFYYWPWDETSDIVEDKEDLLEQYLEMFNNNYIPLLTPRNLAEYLTCSDDHILCNDIAYIVKGFPRIDIDYLDNIHVLRRTNIMMCKLYDISNNSEKHYETFDVKKRAGSLRTIYAPKHELKYIQKWIAKYILSSCQVSENAKAYKKGSSIIDNAKYHVNRPVIVKTDISDFFGSIKLNNRRNSYVIKNSYEYKGYIVRKVKDIHKKILCVRDVFSDIYSTEVASLLANLCCLNGRLPQGAPTSPALSNIVFYPLDKRIEAYCRYNGITYTRYSDDMSFSGDFDPTSLLKTLRFILNDGGFTINNDKTRILRRGQCQQITGLTVNKRLQVSKPYRKKIRQIMYYMKKYGVREHILNQYEEGKHEVMRFVRNGKVYQICYLRSLLGKVKFVLLINPKDKEFKKYYKEIWSMIGDRRRMQEQYK